MNKYVYRQVLVRGTLVASVWRTKTQEINIIFPFSIQYWRRRTYTHMPNIICVPFSTTKSTFCHLRVAKVRANKCFQFSCRQGNLDNELCRFLGVKKRTENGWNVQQLVWFRRSWLLAKTGAFEIHLFYASNLVPFNVNIMIVVCGQGEW